VAIESAAPDTAVSGATVSIRASDGRTVETTSQNDGSFELKDVATGPATITVRPPAQGHKLKPVTLDIEVGEDGQGEPSVVAALEPADQPIEVGRIEISPQEVAARPGSIVDFIVTIYDGQGQPLSGITPSWVVDKGLGRIDRLGRFRALRVGRGKVRVFAGDKHAEANLTVNPH